MDNKVNDELDFEVELYLLDRNIRKICASDDICECQRSYAAALLRLKCIVGYRCGVLSEGRVHE